MHLLDALMYCKAELALEREKRREAEKDAEFQPKWRCNFNIGKKKAGKTHNSWGKGKRVGA
jgi:hypothetical protein